MTAELTPDPTTEGRRRNMAAIRRRDTKPELALRSYLHRAGYRFRVDMRLDLPGGRVRPDIVFTRQKVAVFVDGCFFHACPEHGVRKTIKNEAYWGPKIAGNVERDRKADQLLAEASWKSVRVWSHEPVDRAGELVVEALQFGGT